MFAVEYADGRVIDLSTGEFLDADGDGPLEHQFETNANQSRLQYFLDCKRKYWWQFEEGLIPDRPRWALEDGKAIHVALAEQAGGKSVDEAVKLALVSLEEGMPKKRMPFDDNELQQHKDLVERVVRGYFEHYGPGQMWAPFGVEVSGRVEVGKGTGVFLIFRTDRLVNWANRVWIIDHKSAAKMDPRDLMKYEMDLQFSAYVYGASKILGIRVAGVIVDVLVKTKVLQFEQQPFVRSDRELEEFEAEFIEMTRELRWRRERVKAGEDPKIVFYKNTKECFRYGTCPYRDLCLDDTPTKRLLFISREKDYVDERDIADRATLSAGRKDDSQQGPDPEGSDVQVGGSDTHP